MREVTLEECFETLGIRNGDSFSVARKAFKQKMHRSHPDRFPNDKEAQRKAADNFSHIKKCFKIIEEHYELYGEMPFVEPFETESENSQESLSRQKNDAEESLLKKASAISAESNIIYLKESKQHHYTQNNNNNDDDEKSSSAGEIAAGLFVIGILAYFVLNPPTEKFWLNQEKNKAKETTSQLSSRESQPSEEESIIDFEKNPHINDELTQETEKARELLAKTQRRLQESSSGDTFTFGSSYKEVAAIHGAPDLSEKNTWYYDKSKVVFEDGKVVDWKSDPSYPLATRLKINQ